MGYVVRSADEEHALRRYLMLEGTDLDGFGRHTLGFSLKPPKWLRKAQPGKLLKKAAVPLALTAGALLIPGAAPLLARGVVGAGRLVAGAAGVAARGAGAAGRLIGRNVGRAAHVIEKPFQKAVSPLAKQAEQAARDKLGLPSRRGAYHTPPILGPDEQAPAPRPRMAPAGRAPADSPEPAGPPISMAPAIDSGGGGASAPAMTAASPDEAAAAPGAMPGWVLPAAIIGGGALLLMASQSKRRGA